MLSSQWWGIPGVRPVWVPRFFIWCPVAPLASPLHEATGVQVPGLNRTSTRTATCLRRDRG